MQELTPVYVKNSLEAAKRFLRRLRTVPIVQEIATRLPTAAADALRRTALHLRQQGKEISKQQIETLMWEAMETSFVDNRIYEVADRAMIDVYPTLKSMVKLCTEEVFNASDKDLNKALLFLDFSITLFKLPRRYRQLL